MITIVQATFPTPQAVPDTIMAPLPAIAQVSRWMFQLPQFVQILAAIVGGGLAILLAVKLVRNRKEIGPWYRARSTAVKAGLIIVGAVALAAASWGGTASWDYMQHSNEFCVSCHLMDEPFVRFSLSEHADLGCHDCHQQLLSESMRQLYLWVAERPDEIGPHSGVPNDVCGSCHITEDPDSTWQFISATAGHRVHLESDSASLQDPQCVTCHGAEIHQFVPTSETCGQSDCHAVEDTRVMMEGMSSDSLAIHCTICHQFTSTIDTQAPRAEAFGQLIPNFTSCSSCHEMQDVIVDLGIEETAHEGACGACHKPHTQEDPALAFESCATSGCHGEFEEESPFHRDDHAAVAADCAECHDSHEWIAPIRCNDCHETIPG